eukprot:TRINITY_DN2513_c0_g1_i2.p1 TRINITY_DN2513_c0_g1~~TRINITY_DN2513_c0_g1_i2.p1  ORF type:complete len:211 (-),score=50.51 TRINITY_DN2513_c0_g1_i2:64-696(-)
MSERALGGFKCFNSESCDGVSVPSSQAEDARVVCSRCGFVSNKKHSELQATASTILTIAAEAQKASTSEDTNEALRKSKLKLERAHELQKDILHELNYDRVSLTNNLQNLCISLSEFDQAKLYAKIVLQAYEKVYNPIWPSLGLQYYTYGKLLRYFDEIESARVALNKASDILKITHGAEHPLVRDLELLRQQNEMEIAFSGGSIRAIAQ